MASPKSAEPRTADVAATPPGGHRRPLWTPPRKSLWALPAGLALALVAFAVRGVMPGADPPRWLASGQEAASVAEGPRAVAGAAAALGAPYAARSQPAPALDEASGRPLVGWAALASFRLSGGFAPARVPLYAALSGALLVLAVFLGLLCLAGDRVAIAAAAALALDAQLVGWARAGHPLTLCSLGGALAVIVAAAGRGGPLAVLAAILIAAGAAWGAGIWAGFAALPVLALGVQALARHRGERGRTALWIVLGAFVLLTAAVLAASPALVARGLEHVRALGSDLGPRELAARALAAPARSRVGATAPLLLGLALAGPFLIPRGEAAGKAHTSLARALVALAVVGFLAVGILAPDDAVAVAAFHPGVVVLGVLSVDGLARGGARRPRLAGVAWFVWGLFVGAALVDAAATAVAALDHRWPRLVEEALRWLGARGAASAHAALLPNRLLLAAGPAAVLAGLASQRPEERRRRPRRGLARGLFAAHLAAQAGLLAVALVEPRGTLEAARVDAAALLPEGAVLTGTYAHALAVGGRAAALRPAEGPLDLDAEARRGATHAVVESARFDADTLPRARRAGRRVEEVASLYAAGQRLRLVRLDGRSPPPSALEEARRRIEAGDLAGARAALARAVADHPDAQLPGVLAALTEALAGDLGAASVHAEAARRAAPSSAAAALAAALVAGSRGRANDCEARLTEAARAAAEPELWSLLDDLRAARAAGDQRRIDEALGPRLRLLVGDLLR